MIMGTLEQAYDTAAGGGIVHQQDGEVISRHERLQQSIDLALAVAVVRIGEIRRNSDDAVRNRVIGAVEISVTENCAARMIGAGLIGGDRNSKGIAVTPVLLIRRM